MAVNPIEKRRALRKAAMPEVKKLVKRFGRTTVMNCINQLKEHDKTLKKIAELRREAARLKRQI